MPESLLRVDHRAAISKVIQGQLPDPAAMPAEVVRALIARRSDRIEVDIQPRALRFVAYGASIDSADLKAIAALLDRELDARLQHAEVLALERREGLGLAAISVLPAEEIRVRLDGREVLHRQGDRLAVHRLDLGTEARFDLEVYGWARGRGRQRPTSPRAASDWLESVGRFSPCPIHLNRSARPLRLEPGHTACSLSHRSTGEPLRAWLRPAYHRDQPSLWILRHGLLATRASLPGKPGFDAVIEMGSISKPGASSAELRRSLTPYVRSLLGRMTEIWIQSKPERAEPGRRRRSALLECARLGHQVARIRSLPLYRDATTDRRWSLDQLSRSVRVGKGGECELLAAFPGMRTRKHHGSSTPLPVVPARDRELLAELLEVEIRGPRPTTRSSWRDRSRRALESLRSLLLGFSSVGEKHLSEGERELLETIRSGAGDIDPLAADLLPELRFRDRISRPVRTRDGRLLLPRDTSLIDACRRRLRADPSQLYPVLLALLAPAASPPEALLRPWLASFEKSGTAAPAPRLDERHSS